MKSFYITTPIYYVNDKAHIGHAYTDIASDFVARFKRLDNYKVMFLTGTDEHGQKVEKSAIKAGVTPQDFTDQVSLGFRNLSQQLNLSNDDFIRTTEERHKKAAKALWQEIEAKGHIYLSSYSGWYAVRDEAFYSEKELVDGKAPTGAEVEWHEEESYFFNLSKWQDKLLEFYAQNPDFVFPESRFNEVKRFVEGGLEDLSISRTSFKWGIEVPESKNATSEQHIMYVWFDALSNYISAIGYPDREKLAEFWPADIHMVGKDILRFHAVYWPAFLMAADLPLPKKIVAHGWWTNEGQKISKSVGNVIDPVALTEEFSIDYLRYFLMREMPFGNDGNYSRKSFVNRINADLCNNVGNLLQRTISFAYKNFDGSIPNVAESDYPELKEVENLLDLCRQDIDQQNYQSYLEKIMSLATSANVYIDKMAPWKLKKEDPAKCAEVIYILLETIRNIAILLLPIIPESAAKMLEVLGVAGQDSFAFYGSKSALKAGSKIMEPNIIFLRVENTID
jgi:methionyl-tRNA synthetase